jgi:hypothetical protein
LEQRPPGDLRLSVLKMSQTHSLTGRARMSDHGDFVVRTKRKGAFLCCVASHHAYDSQVLFVTSRARITRFIKNPSRLP